jgi:hypothetical protein
MHKFEQLEVWTLAIEYTDMCYSIEEYIIDSRTPFDEQDHD